MREMLANVYMNQFCIAGNGTQERSGVGQLAFVASRIARALTSHSSVSLPFNLLKNIIALYQPSRYHLAKNKGFA